MKNSRTWLVWGLLTLCAIMVITAMAWLTQGVLAAERTRVMAESRADLEERTRLALWRMDAVGAAIVSKENRHDPNTYEDLNHDAMVRLHFELQENGKLRSASAGENQENLNALRQLLRQNPLPGSEWSLLQTAVKAGESAWQAVPKKAVEEKIQAKQPAGNASGGSSLKSEAYQSNFNSVERAKRAQTVDAAVAQSAEMPAASVSKKLGLADAQLDEFGGIASKPQTESLAAIGTMRAVWIGEEIFLLRQVTKTLGDRVEQCVQGAWLDVRHLKKHLLSEVVDLLPEADFTKAENPATDPLSLVSFPFHLARNEALPDSKSSLGAPLFIGWGAVLLALFTASFLVHGIMRLSERRASFVSAVTHELRTPLTTFRLYSDMLESGAVRPEKRGDYLRVLSREADRLAHLVENVLSFSKIERGSARSAVRETTVEALLEPMRERLESRLVAAGLVLTMDLAHQVGARSLRVDAAAVEHVLFNLIDNAAKYAAASQPAQVEIEVRATPRQLEIRVIDHGPGIPISERKRIFRAFHKSAREAAESRPGVGLGLALSRRLAASLGGSLVCEDAPHGACFALRLPLAQGPVTTR